MDLPEYLEQTNQGDGRLHDEDVTCLHQLGPEFNRAAGGGEDSFLNGYYLDH